MTNDFLNELKEQMLKKEDSLSKFGAKSKDAIRVLEEDESGELRPAFYHDIDRIIHALSYTRYLDKTQVFSFRQDEDLSKRIVHVQLVSKIARTIARCLNLNEDLTEAISLGHDIGHTPIGHVGEKILNDISIRELGEYFGHNIQSVRTYLTIEKHGVGMNLSIQVLDGILCHNGEIIDACYRPVAKTRNKFLEEYKQCYIDKDMSKKLRPMTLEGCIVRISDLIGYLGRDIEDAIRIGLINRESIPEIITKVLGNNNKDIVDTIIKDVVVNSYNKPYIKMSDRVYQAMTTLKDFNYSNIYSKANSKEEIEILKIKFEYLYSTYLMDLESNNLQSEIYINFLNDKDISYLSKTSNKRKVIDFISGMTDEYFINCYEVRK
ncbi:MAG: HD domain-containing protein [Bacilli bacterium]